MSETGNTTNASVGMQQPNATVTKRKGVAEITVRTLQDTLKDAEFAARLLLEGFRAKMVHAVGEKNISICLKNAVCNHRGLDPAFYSRNFVAECEGRRAGIVQIAFTGDKYFQKKDHLSEMSYYAQLRWFFLSFVQEKVPPGMCYVDHIVVEEEFRGKGVGKVLLETAENAAREKKCDTIYLEVVASNPRAKSLYERVGYEAKSEVKLYGLLWYLIGERSMFRMEKSLRKP